MVTVSIIWSSKVEQDSVLQGSSAEHVYDKPRRIFPSGCETRQVMFLFHDSGEPRSRSRWNTREDDVESGVQGRDPRRILSRHKIQGVLTPARDPGGNPGRSRAMILGSSRR
jgi:hypothetical protein